MAMLSDDLSGRSYSKAEHNRALQQLIGRGRGSIEYKHQNISAVLKGIGETELAGYKPAFNYQASLEDAVDRWLAERPGWYAHRPQETAPAGVHETGALWIGTAPTLQNAPPPDEADQMARIARQFDAAERDDRNRKLGRAGEERVVDHERSSLSGAGRADLARKVRWVSEEDGDGLGYDILSFEPNGAERLIEVKTTNGWERTPFHISRNEIAVAEERKDDWHLIRLWDFARSPKAFAIRPPWNGTSPSHRQASVHHSDDTYWAANRRSAYGYQAQKSCHPLSELACPEDPKSDTQRSPLASWERTLVHRHHIVVGPIIIGTCQMAEQR